MFVDEINISAKAGNGGDGVVRWHREKFKPKGGPAGGNGGGGGDVYVRAVSDLNRLAKYTGAKLFKAEDGQDGQGNSKHGQGGEDIFVDIPVGSKVTDLERGRIYELTKVGDTEKILHGGPGGLGNEYFKSSTNRAPENATRGKAGESGNFLVELSLVVDVGLVGLPNAGKSTLLNSLTNAKSAIGSYPFTTTEPHLGVVDGCLLADIPGLIEGAAAGKGLGHKFLRHVSRTKMLLHLVSLADTDPISSYYTIKKELSDYSEELSKREEWIVLTKKDLLNKEDLEKYEKEFDKISNHVFVVSSMTGEGLEKLQDSLVSYLKAS